MSSSDSSHAVVPVSTYLAVFAVLIALTVLTMWVATIDLGDINVVVALVVAAIKAVLVLLFFMHLRHGSRLLWLALGFSFGFVAILISIVASDVFTRGHWAPLGPNVPDFSLSAPSEPR